MVEERRGGEKRSKIYEIVIRWEETKKLISAG